MMKYKMVPDMLWWYCTWRDVAQRAPTLRCPVRAPVRPCTGPWQHTPSQGSQRPAPGPEVCTASTQPGQRHDNTHHTGWLNSCLDSDDTADWVLSVEEVGAAGNMRDMTWHYLHLSAVLQHFLGPILIQLCLCDFEQEEWLEVVMGSD